MVQILCQIGINSIPAAHWDSKDMLATRQWNHHAGITS